VFVLKVQDEDFAQGFGWAYHGEGWALTARVEDAHRFPTRNEAETVAYTDFTGRITSVESAPAGS
jgi:hypothetical protein